MKMWSGRFEKETDKLADAFNRSLDVDIRLYDEDITGSIAHCTMLAECGILSREDCALIVENLRNIREEIASGKLLPNDAEDVHMFVESELISRIGEAGKRLHTSRSRNDQVATDFRLHVKRACDRISGRLSSLIEKLLSIAEENLETIMPGYTHLQKAQPVTLAHHLCAYCEMFLRDKERFADAKKRTDVLPLGACALAGTTYPIDRNRTAELLGFSRPAGNSLDAVSDRDFACEFLFCCSLVAMHVSRLSEEMVLWSTDEFRFIRIDDTYSTGSSIMPQKKNPDICELLRGKTGRVYGNLVSLLTVLKGLPLAYNKDLQEDKECLFDSEDTILASLAVLEGMLGAVTFNREVMRTAAEGGFLNATDIADYLVKKGIPFRTAHEITGKLVLYAEKHNCKLGEIPVEIYREYSDVFDEKVLDAVKIENVVAGRACIGGPAPAAVRAEIAEIRRKNA